MEKIQFEQKNTGDELSASEWNQLTNYVNQVVDVVNSGESGSGDNPGDNPTPTPIDTSGLITVNNKGNVTIGSNDIKNINLEPGYPYSQNTSKYGDIALKPGDDIQFCSHHREPKKRDKVVLKNIDGNDNPVKFQAVAGEIELAVGTENNPKTATKKKDKTTGEDTSEVMFKSSDAKVLDIKILTGNVLDKNTNNERDERGYLKVRAQAIDLRCEKHGGIALQPKGYDGDGNMNKIKFEHGGGDGLEFGTFNTEKSSLFTGEYRFNKDGIWKMATRQTTASGKDIIDEGTIPSGKSATGAYKYVKQADDFYDIINPEDDQCTTKDIIKTAKTLNGTNGVEVHITSKGNLEIETSNKDIIIKETVDSGVTPELGNLPELTPENANVNKWYEDNGAYSRVIAQESPNINIETDSSIKLSSMHACVWDDVEITAENFSNFASQMGTGLKKDTDPASEYVDGLIYGITDDDRTKKQISMVSFDEHLRYVMCRQISEAGGINLESDAKIKISAPKLTLEGVTGFGSTMTFGETDEGIRYQYKATKKGNNKQCDIIQIEVQNNSDSQITFNESTSIPSNSEALGGTAGNKIPTFCQEGNITVPAKSSVVIAQASIYDIIKLVNWAKVNEFGPWAPQL